MSSPFSTLNISADSTEQQVIKAWRALACKHHPDKAGGDEEFMKTLNNAKEQCLDAIISRNYSMSEHEFVRHICRILENRLGDLQINLSESSLIKPMLRKFMWIRAVGAMERVLHCMMGDWDFDQAIEDEVPILCKYYNAFIGEQQWEDDEHTFMVVLNKYDEIKAKGYGNFGRRLEAGEISSPSYLPDGL